MDGYIGEIRAFGFNFTPQYWLPCNGDTLSAQQYPALYAVVGNTYGQAPQGSFKLPDLRGAAPMHAGVTGGTPGAPSMIVPGERLGDASVTLAVSESPSHTHQVTGASVSSSNEMKPAPDPTSMVSRPMNGTTAFRSFSNQDNPNTAMAPQMVQVAGGGAPHDNMQPYLVLNFCICVDGEFPVPGD